MYKRKQVNTPKFKAILSILLAAAMTTTTLAAQTSDSANDCVLANFKTSDIGKKLINQHYTRSNQSGIIIDSHGDYKNMLSQLQQYANQRHCQLYLLSEKQMMQATLQNKHISQSDKKSIRKHMNESNNLYALDSAFGLAALGMLESSIKPTIIKPNK